jgi:PEP-CTERM motif
MNRTNFSRFGLVVVTLVAAAILFQTPSAHGQITNGATSTNYEFSYTGGAGSLLSLFGLTATGANAAGSNSLTLTGDFDDSLPSVPGQASIDIYGYLPIAVGNLPVQISNFQLNVNAKWVNGGGSATAPNPTRGSLFAAIYQQLGAPPVAPNNPGPGGPQVTYSNAATVATIVGNGYQIAPLTTTAGNPSTYVLAAQTNYYLMIDDHTFSDNSMWDNTMPSVVLTNEFGGPLDGFSGFVASYSWTTVPEPSTLALLAIGSIGLLVARRRR